MTGTPTEGLMRPQSWLDTFIESFGVSTDDAGPEAYGIDFNNAIIGNPFITGTGYLPDRETAEGVANIVLPLINALAITWLDENPEKEAHLGWTNPRMEAERSWATIVSKARKGYGGDPEDGEPVYEEMYEGDEWFVASAELGLVTPEQQAMVDKVNAALRARAS